MDGPLARVYRSKSNCKPMPENSWQADTVHVQRDMLATRYAGGPDTFVCTDMLLSYKDGQRKEVVAPDLMVVFGVPAKNRDSYEVRKEGKVPDFVLEVASKGTYRKDLGSKKDKYEWMGVREYCVFDPKGGMHRPRLQLFRLEGGVYERVSGRGDPDGPLAVTSETLGLELRLEDDRLRLWDPEAQEYLLEPHEEHAGRLKERARCLKERKGRIKERAKRIKERDGRLKERDKRIESEQRVRDLETRLAGLKERRPGKP